MCFGKIQTLVTSLILNHQLLWLVPPEQIVYICNLLNKHPDNVLGLIGPFVLVIRIEIAILDAQTQPLICISTEALSAHK